MGTLDGDYIFGCDFPTPAGGCDSFNLSGSHETLASWQRQRRLRTIPSSVMAEMRPCKAILSWMPGAMRDKVVFTGFKLALGRMPPTIPNVSVKSAEGLVHLVPNQTRGANWKAVETLFLGTAHAQTRGYTSLNAVPESDVAEGTVYHALAVQYFKDVFGEGYGTRLAYGIASIRSLARMNFALAQIIPGLWEGRERVYYSTWKDEQFGGDAAVRAAFETFKASLAGMDDGGLAVLNPLYDLYACVQLLHPAVTTKAAFWQHFRPPDAATCSHRAEEASSESSPALPAPRTPSRASSL